MIPREGLAQHLGQSKRAVNRSSVSSLPPCRGPRWEEASRFARSQSVLGDCTLTALRGYKVNPQGLHTSPWGLHARGQPSGLSPLQEFIRLGSLSKLSGKGLQQRMFFLVSGERGSSSQGSCPLGKQGPRGGDLGWRRSSQRCPGPSC